MKKYLIKQKVTLFANQYEIFETDGTEERMIAFAQQKRLALKEQITFYTDGSKPGVIFEVKARSVIDLGAKYDVWDGDGNVLGVIGKAFRRSLVSSTWYICDADNDAQPQLVVEESNITVALIRRLWQFLPVVNNIPFIIKYHFDFRRQAAGEVVAEYRKVTLIRDHYELVINDESLLSQYDWRVFAAMGVLLDALQSR